MAMPNLTQTSPPPRTESHSDAVVPAPRGSELVLRWQQANGRRHALRQPRWAAPLEAEHEFTALCGETVTTAPGDVHPHDAPWLDETCWGCKDAWLAVTTSSTGEISLDDDEFMSRLAQVKVQEGLR